MATLKWLLHSAVHFMGHPKNDPKMEQHHQNDVVKVCESVGFQMPLHYPKYTKSDYENMEEWKIDLLLKEYGLVGFNGTLQEKRAFAIGAFLWPRQYE